MAATALASHTVTINGQGFKIVATPEEHDLEGYSLEWETQTAGNPIVSSDVPLYLRNFDRGIGVMERRDETDDDALGFAEDGFTHLDAGLMPSGRRTEVALSTVLSKTDIAIVDSRVFDGHLWCLTSAGVLVRIPNCDPTQAAVFDPPLNTFGAATASFASGYVCRAIEVFETKINTGTGDYDAAGTKVPALYVSTYNASTGATRIYEYVSNRAGADWRNHGGTLGYRADRMAVCWWQGLDGSGAWRLHIVADDNTIRHCIQGSDPTTGASYVTPITVGDAAHPITQLLAAPTHLWVRKTDGWYDVSEIRAGNITPYYAEQPDLSNARIGKLYDGYLVAARQFGLDRYDTRLGELGRQDLPGECGPGFGWQDGCPLGDVQVTGLAQHGGWLVWAGWNSDLLTSYVGRAAFREKLGVRSKNPLVHFGSEQTLKPAAGVGQQITHLAVLSPTLSSGAAVAARTTFMLMFTVECGSSGVSSGFACKLFYAPLPNSPSGPLAMTVSGGSFAQNSPATFYLTAQNWQDRNAAKHVMRFDGVAQGLVDATGTATGNTVEIHSRQDKPPGSILTLSTWKSEGTANGSNGTDAFSITPATATTAHNLGIKVILTPSSPYTTPLVLREVSPRARVARELLSVRTLWVLCERNHRTARGAPDRRSPDVVLDALYAIQSVAPVTFVDELGRSYSVIVEQGIAAHPLRVNGRQMGTVARVRLRLVA